MITINFRNSEYFPAKLQHYIVNDYLIKRGLGRIDKGSTNPDFGNYGLGVRLGWGYKNSHTYKRYLHNIFRNQVFYPQTMVIKKSWVKKNKQIVADFINGGRFVVKPDKGQSGKGISIVNNVEDVLKMTDDNFWVLQKVIEPKLYNNKKFDLRIFHFILRIKNNYYNILSKVGVAKTCVKNYTESIDGFLTNIVHNNKLDKNEEHLFDFFDFMGRLEGDEEKRKGMILKVYNVIRAYSLLMSRKLESDNKSYAQIMMYGPDLIMDERDNVYLLETNCSAGILIKGEVSYNKQRKMIDELMGILVPLMEGREVDLEGYVGELLFIEKLS